MCSVLTVPKGNFIENKGDRRAAQITHARRERDKDKEKERETLLLLGPCCPTEEHYYWIIDLWRKMDGT